LRAGEFRASQDDGLQDLIAEFRRCCPARALRRRRIDRKEPWEQIALKAVEDATSSLRISSASSWRSGCAGLRVTKRPGSRQAGALLEPSQARHPEIRKIVRDFGNHNRHDG